VEDVARRHVEPLNLLRVFHVARKDAEACASRPIVDEGNVAFDLGLREGMRAGKKVNRTRQRFSKHV
jgi:hypothetical protein